MAGPGRKAKVKKRGWTNPDAVLELRDVGLRSALHTFRRHRDSTKFHHPNVPKLKKLGLSKFLQDAWKWQKVDYCEEFIRGFEPARMRTIVCGTKVDLGLESFVKLTGLDEGGVRGPAAENLYNFSCEKYFPDYSLVPKRSERVYDLRQCKEKGMASLVALLVRTVWLRRQCTHAPASLMYLLSEAEDGAKVNWGGVLHTLFIAEIGRLHHLLAVNKKTTTSAGPLMCFLLQQSARDQQVALDIPPPPVLDSDDSGEHNLPTGSIEDNCNHPPAGEFWEDEEDDDYEVSSDNDGEQSGERGGAVGGESLGKRSSGRALCLTGPSSSSKAPPRTPKKRKLSRAGLTEDDDDPPEGPGTTTATPSSIADKWKRSFQKVFQAMRDREAGLVKGVTLRLGQALKAAADDKAATFDGLMHEWEAMVQNFEPLHEELLAWRSAAAAVGIANPSQMRPQLLGRVADLDGPMMELQAWQALGLAMKSPTPPELKSTVRQQQDKLRRLAKLYREEQAHAGLCVRQKLHAETLLAAAESEIASLRLEVRSLKDQLHGASVMEQFPKEQVEIMRRRMEEAILQKDLAIAEKNEILRGAAYNSKTPPVVCSQQRTVKKEEGSSLDV